MFQYLARQDIQDDAATANVPPLILLILDRNAPPSRIDDPVVTSGDVISGCSILEYWDTYENIGMCYTHPERPTEMTQEQAAEYLSSGLWDPSGGDTHANSHSPGDSV